jgi:flagellar biosynthesis component FlhA
MKWRSWTSFPRRPCRVVRRSHGDPMDAVLKLDELMLEVGMGLVPLVDAKQGGQLLARVKSMRKNLAQQLGFLVPSIHITDNLSLKDREYVIYLRGVEIARWELRRDCLLAISSNADAPICPARIPASRPSMCPQSGSLRKPRARRLPLGMRSWTRHPCLPLIWRK